MSDERASRIARNEALFRQVNESGEELSVGVHEMLGQPDEFLMVCECGVLTCTLQISLSRAVYRETRTNPMLFIVTPGHEIRDVERVVERSAGYLVVEKHKGRKL